MLALPLLLLTLTQSPLPSGVVPADTTIATGPARDSTRVAMLVPVDTPVVRRRAKAVEYSDAYYTRLTIHRYASYTMLPLFASEYALGQNLINDSSPASWIKPTHAVVAGGLGVLFGVNTITGVWNLYEARDDPAGRTRRIVHSALMLASDAGFALTGAMTPGNHYSNYADYQHQVNVHRGLAISSMAVSTIGWGMMWLWKE